VEVVRGAVERVYGPIALGGALAAGLLRQHGDLGRPCPKDLHDRLLRSAVDVRDVIAGRLQGHPGRASRPHDTPPGQRRRDRHLGQLR